MQEPTTIDSGEVTRRLPDGWRAENDGDEHVYVYPQPMVDRYDHPGDMPASFGIAHKEGEVFTATMQEPSAMRSGLHELSAHAEGARGRMIEWVVERAEGVDWP